MPNLVEIGTLVSEIFLKVYIRRKTPSDGKSSHDPMDQVS